MNDKRKNPSYSNEDNRGQTSNVTGDEDISGEKGGQTGQGDVGNSVGNSGNEPVNTDESVTSGGKGGRSSFYADEI